jgi:predicted secreted protein
MRSLLFAAAVLLIAPAAFADNIVITPANDGQTFAMKVGECLDVRLSSQAASTGYQWYLAPGLNEAISLAARTVTTPGNAAPGTPEQLDFILCAAAPAEVPVTFLNYRPWEKNVLPAKALRFTAKIAP